jgi:uncharacterized protein (TIRG00374 family)
VKASHKQLWFGITLSLVLVILLLQGTDFHQLAEAFRHADYIYCLPMIVAALAGIVIRAFRWKLIMRPLHRASFNNLFSATMVGFMANFVLPARIGEFIRAYLIGKKEKLSKSAAFATIVVERLFDTFTIILVLAVVLFVLSFPGQGLEGVYGKALRWAGVTMCVLFMGLLLLLVLLKQKTRLTLTWIEVCLRPFPKAWGNKILEILKSFVTGLGAVKFGTHLFSILFYSFLLWGAYGTANGFVLRALNIELPFYVPFYLLVVQAIGVAVPSSPGFVGTYHAAVVAGLAAFKVPQEAALSFAILSHFLLIVPVILYGLVLLWREHLSLHTLGAEAGRNRDE